MGDMCGLMPQQPQQPQQQGQQTLDFAMLVKKSAEASFVDFKTLCDIGPELSDTERKIGLLKFINKTRQRLLRLLVLTKWCAQIPLVECCQQLVGTLSNHDTSFIQAADSLFFLHDGLQQARAPMYDIPSAIEILLTGSYRRLPKCIEDLGIQPMLMGDEKRSMLEKLDTMLRARLLDIPLPREMSAANIKNGRVTISVDEEFEVQLTLGYRGNPYLWRVLHIEILVGEASGRLKLVGPLETTLRDDLERRMAALDNPFEILFSVLHDFCMAWVMDTIIRQVRILRQERWRDAIRFDIIQDATGGNLSQASLSTEGEVDVSGSGKSQSSPSLKIGYWLDAPKVGDSAVLPSLRIEQQSDHTVICSHVPSVIDPVNNQDAHFQIHTSSLDVERLLLHAIQCNIHTRLLDVQRTLKNSAQLSRVETDVILKNICGESQEPETALSEECREIDVGEVGEEALCVQMYGTNYVTLGINMRTGSFLLRSLHTLIPPALLCETEDALNQGSILAVDAFLSLRNKSLLHLYASIGTTYNFKVYEKGAIMFKASPDGVKPGVDALIMGFPDCGHKYFLSLQLNDDFMPMIMIFEGQLYGQTAVLSRTVQLLHYMRIPLEWFSVTEDEVNFSFFSEVCATMKEQESLDQDLQHMDLENESGGARKLEMISGRVYNGRPLTARYHEDWPLDVSQGSKRRKVDADVRLQATSSLNTFQVYLGQPYASLLDAANQGKAPMCLYTSFFLQVVRRCSLCIKKARLTTQMDLLGIQHVEELGLSVPSMNFWFRLPMSRTGRKSKQRGRHGWENIRVCLDKPGIGAWEVKIQDEHYKALYEIQDTKTSLSSQSVQFIASEADSHIQCSLEGLVLVYQFAEENSVQTMLADLERLWHARAFVTGMRKLLDGKGDDKMDLTQEKLLKKGLANAPEGERMSEAMKKAFRVEAIGLTSVWFVWFSSITARFVVEWERGKKGCTVHVSPDQLWPHTKYLEDFIDGGEVELLLDCIRVTAGPLQALAGAIRPARLPVGGTPMTSLISVGANGTIKTGGQVLSPNNPPVASPPSNPPGRCLVSGGIPASTNANVMIAGSSVQSTQNGNMVSGPGRGTGLVPSSLLPTDVSVVLRSAYWIRIIYRRQFAVDMRCFAGDHVWLQPAPPPHGLQPGVKGSLPCPQFRPFVLEQLTTGYNNMDLTPTTVGGQPSQAGSLGGMAGHNQGLVQVSNGSSGRVSIGAIRPSLGGTGQQGTHLLRLPGGPAGSQPTMSLGNVASGRAIVPGMGMTSHSSHRELNPPGYGYSDDGGYGGVWVPLSFLKKVLRGILRYLGVVWLFAQFPDIIKEVLASHLRENEGALLNHDPEAPALRFYIQNCVFAVSVHRQQLILQAINVKRYQSQPQQQQGQQQPVATSVSDNDLSPAEMQEIGDFFTRRAAYEPYDASRLASFVTMLTLPVPVLREFIGLIAWKRETAKVIQHMQMTDPNQPSRPKLELCLENRSASHDQEELPLGASSSPKSSIAYDRSRNLVDFTLTVVFDPAHIPHLNVAGGAGWLPQCVAVRLRYMFGDGGVISLRNMEGSHGGRAFWSLVEDWERCKEKVARAVEVAGGGNGAEQGQGRLRTVAEAIQTALQSALQQLRRGVTGTPP